MAFRLISASKLQLLIAAITRSPIIARLRMPFFTPSDWARIRNSPEVDAFVLAWIASHVRQRRRPRALM